MQCRAQGISKRFNRNQVLDRIDLEIDPGDRIAILGSNGSGKSTLLRILAGQLAPSKGKLSYSIQDSEIDTDKVYRHLTLVGPYTDVYRQFTFSELVDFHFSLRELRSDLDRADVLKAIDVPLKRPLRSFSSGMLQRVKLVLAFATQAEIVLLDEPTMNLDDAGVAWFENQIAGLPDDVTLVIASNEPERETRSCTTRYRLDSGTLRPEHK
ncbi:MAG: ABC transporter ATP-binding protein [Flavobacteriales bacterium]|nr:ABC transporter ATP-binding protein [Flavobacteriales bacterium]